MSCRVVFEAGPTHSGLDEALKLVEVAAESEVDAIKFQLIDADRLVADREKLIGFQVLENGKMAERAESLHAVLKRRELLRNEWKTLRNAVEDRGLAFYCTATYEDEFDFLIQDLKVDALKVASADIDNLPLLRYLADQKDVEIHIDTGSANIWEVDRAVEILREPVIHHVPSGYPAHLPSIHLNVIKTLRLMYPEHTIGFSDHSPGWDMDIAAVALGAGLVEKTITLDRHKQEIEHCFSLEPDDAKGFVKRIRDLEIALGSTRRTIPHMELASRKGYRRSVYLTRTIPAGHVILPDALELRRPGFDGIPPEALPIVKGRPAKRDLSPGPLKWSDV
jgi:N,N'-diacetyllegionaminate synthase